MNTQTPNNKSTASKKVTVENLLQMKRQERPSEAYWSSKFEKTFTRRLIGEVARPRHKGRALKVVGWSTPVVFGAVMLVAIAVAYLFSPSRTIARWEAGTKGRNYVVDTLQNDTPAKNYRVDGVLGDFRMNVPPAEGVASYEFAPATQKTSNF